MHSLRNHDVSRLCTCWAQNLSQDSACLSPHSRSLLAGWLAAFCGLHAQAGFSLLVHSPEAFHLSGRCQGSQVLPLLRYFP